MRAYQQKQKSRALMFSSTRYQAHGAPVAPQNGPFFGFLGRFSDCGAGISAMKRPQEIPLSIEPVIFGVDSKMVISAKKIFSTFFSSGLQVGLPEIAIFRVGSGGRGPSGWEK